MNLYRFLTPIAVLAALALAASPASAAAAPATLPTWTQGQAVGYGTNLNLTALAEPFLNAVKTNPASFNLTAVNKLDFTGSLDIWVHDQVTQKTDTYYVLTSRAADGLKFRLEVNVSAQGLPAPGTYTGTCSGGSFVPPTIPTSTRTIAATVSWTSLDTSDGTGRYAISNLALLNETVNTATKARATVATVGFPQPSINLTRCEETITYASRSFTLLVNTTTQLRSLFTPPLDVFNFPINDNETWWANSTATAGATVSGTVDVQGVSAADERAFLENLTAAFKTTPGLAVTGLDAFPIDLAKIGVMLGAVNYLQNGVVADQTRSVKENLRAKASAMTLSDSAIHNVYLITPASYECPAASANASQLTVAAVYAPDFPAPNAGMIVGYEAYLCLGTMQQPIFELKNVPASQAENNIGNTKTVYDPTPPAAPSTRNAIADFFIASPFYGIWIIVAAVALVTVLVIFRRRRRPAPAPPQSPPPMAQEPPPGPP